VDRDNFPIEVQVIDAAVAVDEPVAGCAAGDAEEPKFGQEVFPEVAGVVVVELIGGEVIYIEPAGAGLDPHFTFRAFEDLFDKVIADGVGVMLVVAKDLEFVAVIAIKAGHGAKPHKTARVLIETGNVIVGEAVGKVESRKLIVSRLCK